MYFQKTRDLLVQEATDLFYEYGYVKTPIRKITEKLNVENTIIYYYFKNKDELLFSIIEGIIDDMLRGLENVIHCIPDPMERVQQMIFFQISLLGDRKKEVKIFVEDTDKLTLEMQKKIRDKERMVYDLYAKQFALLITEKKIKKIEIPVITFTIFGAINWIYRWYKEEGVLPLEAVAMRTIEIIFAGLMLERPDRNIK
jgi:TetR/AcrR family transcriptional regulator, cholesterol catabolism regulator